MARKLQYQAISKTLFVPAATIAVFSSFSQPAPAKANVAVETAGPVNAPVRAATAPAVFSQFSQPQFNRATLPDEQPSTLFEIIAPQQPTPVFARFSDPRASRRVLAGFTNAPQPAFMQPYVFGQFSQPFNSRGLIADEMPSALFEVLPPPAPPFTGFAQFQGVIRAKLNIALFSEFRPTPFVIPVDTHDGVWVKKKRKRVGPDPIDLELAEKASRRAALKLAIYGPEVEYSEPPTVFAAPPPKPPDVADLARIVAAAQAAQHQALMAQAVQDDEDDLEAILREIL